MRALFQFKPGLDRARIAKPGFDVNDTVDKLILHESALFSQLMQTGYLANPGHTDPVSITVQRGMGLNVSAYVAIDYGAAKNYPGAIAYGHNTPTILPATIIFTQPNANTMTIQFGHTSVPPGVYYSLWRKN